jgi:hypothetical protein
MATPPVNFKEKVQGATGTSGKDYPYSIKASDLDKNFVFATLEIAEGIYEETAGAGGYSRRRLKIPALPGGGTFVLASVSSELVWLETEACEE